MKKLDRLKMATFVSLMPLISACGGEPDPGPVDPPIPAYTSCRVAGSRAGAACGSGQYDWEGLVPGPKSPDHDVALAAKVRRYDRLFHALHARSTGVNTEFTATDAGDRALITAFAKEDDGWDFAAFAGKKPEDMAGGWSKAAGAYAGVGIAADAFRYATLRDQGADCKEVDVARERLLQGLDALHMATAITGKEGVIARGFARKDVPGAGTTVMTTPLFDADGNPLPTEKNNGTWRDDQSGQYPNYVWEDSCSRDQYVGWAMGYAGAWEAIAEDTSIADDVKNRLRHDATALVKQLMVVGEQGYDLEILDGDGRVTYFGYMNENTVERTYLMGIQNGFMSMLALGIVAGFAYVAEDPYVYQYLYEELGDKRRLHEIARDNMLFVDIGAASNFSNYNMAFLGGLLASRYHCDAEVRSVITTALDSSLYDRGKTRQPKEQKQTLYDFTYVLAQAGSTAYAGLQSAPDAVALANGLETLQGFADAPFWNEMRTNCDEMEIANNQCVADDGTPIEILGPVGHNDELVAKNPLPIQIRPPSNYYWRSNPYSINGGGDGTLLLPAVDARFAYWLGRYSR